MYIVIRDQILRRTGHCQLQVTWIKDDNLQRMIFHYVLLPCIEL